MEATTDPDKMTVEEFNSAVSKWAKTVEASAKGKLTVSTSTVAYGVGRGWNRRKDGSVQVTAKNSKKPRTPKDWLDSVIESHIQDLGDIVGEYYGDKAMQSLLAQFDRIKINKTRING